MQLSFSGACLLLVAAIFALLSGSLISYIPMGGTADGKVSLGLFSLYQLATIEYHWSGFGASTYVPVMSDAEYAAYQANSITIAVCSVLGFLFLIVLFLLLAALASSLVKGIAEPDETPRTLRYMIPAMILAIGLTVCSALTLGSLATLFQEYADGSAVTIATQFTLPIIAAVLSALALILLIVYGALTGGKEDNKD